MKQLSFLGLLDERNKSQPHLQSIYKYSVP